MHLLTLRGDEQISRKTPQKTVHIQCTYSAHTVHIHCTDTVHIKKTRRFRKICQRAIQRTYIVLMFFYREARFSEIATFSNGALYVHCMCTVRVLSVHCMCTVCALYVHCCFTTFSALRGVKTRRCRCPPHLPRSMLSCAGSHAARSTGLPSPPPLPAFTVGQVTVDSTQTAQE